MDVCQLRRYCALLTQDKCNKLTVCDPLGGMAELVHNAERPATHLDVGKPEIDPLPRTVSRAVPTADLPLALGFDQFQHPELLLSDIRQRDCQPDAFRV